MPGTSFSAIPPQGFTEHPANSPLATGKAKLFAREYARRPGTRPRARLPMSPRLVACCEIVMGLTMSYMLVTML
jgi:hypothetical protein